MPTIDRIAARLDAMTRWRRDLHAHPELAFEEHRTADFVAVRLEEFGLTVSRGLARTGLVATISSGSGPAIGLRADMDALPMREANTFAHRSRYDGRMHACGHDGHTTMLLGAAQYLSERQDFRGIVHLIFQPAEESAGGGRVMIEEGLFEQFPVDVVYGMHNWPGLPAGKFAIRPGPIMAATDSFEIILSGQGAHAAMPHLGSDTIVAAAALISGLQTLVSRSADPIDPAVVSVTRVEAGSAWNVLPAEAVIRGTIRSMRAATRDLLVGGMRRIAAGVAAAHDVHADVRFIQGYPATVNDAQAAETAAAAAARVVGAENVNCETMPSMGAEDFAFMLEARPGAYIHIGNGPGTGGCTLHNPRYDFNDEILPIGASYWVRLVESALAP